MLCSHPLKGFVNRKTGGFTFQASQSNGERMSLPCGRCIFCRRSKQQDWGTRVWCEARSHSDSMFMTLTYADEFLPRDGSLSVVEAQNFLKRFRFELGQKRERAGLSPIRIRHLGCGEYGPQTLRPHYHFAIFGHWFDDARLKRLGQAGAPVYTSATLESLWPVGMAEFGRVTSTAGDYIGKYAVKRISGELAESHYTRPHLDTGELVRVRREFLLASRFPGIGAAWSVQFEREWRESGFLIVDGSKRRVPDYFVDCLRSRDPSVARVFAHRAEDRALEIEARYPGRADYERSPERLAVRERFAIAKGAFFDGSAREIS